MRLRLIGMIVFCSLIECGGLRATQLEPGRSTKASEREQQLADPASMRQKQLIRAIRLHDLRAFDTLLKTGLNPDFFSTESLGTPLTEAIAERQPKMVAALLDSHADVNFGETKGVPPLTVASWYDDVHTATELLKRGAKVEVRDVEGYTPVLVAASRATDTTMIKLLIAAGADFSATTKEGDTALIVAAENLNVEAVRLFLDLGLDPCLRNKDGKSAIDYANFEIVKSGPRLQQRKDILDLLGSRCDPR